MCEVGDSSSILFRMLLCREMGVEGCCRGYSGCGGSDGQKEQRSDVRLIRFVKDKANVDGKW